MLVTAAILAKLDRALRILRAGQSKNPRPEFDLAIAAIDSALDDLTGKRPDKPAPAPVRKNGFFG